MKLKDWDQKNEDFQSMTKSVWVLFDAQKSSERT